MKEEFSIKEFEVFVREYIRTDKNPYKNKLDKVVNALCQFEQSSWRFVGVKASKTFSSYIKNNFIEVDKPKAVSYNTYLLYTFGYRYCSGCKTIQTINSFSSSPAKISLSSLCRKCNKEYYSDNKEKEAARGKKYREENKEKISFQRRKYRQNNKEKIATRNKKWQQANPGKIAGYSSSRRAREYNAIPPNQTKSEASEIADFYADKPKGYHVDHIVPLAKGGTHSLINLQYLTAEENHRKHAKYTYNQDDYFLGRIKWW